jgi:hypothetical protein
MQLAWPVVPPWPGLPPPADMLSEREREEGGQGQAEASVPVAFARKSQLCSERQVEACPCLHSTMNYSTTWLAQQHTLGPVWVERGGVGRGGGGGCHLMWKIF